MLELQDNCATYKEALAQSELTVLSENNLCNYVWGQKSPYNIYYS